MNVKKNILKSIVSLLLVITMLLCGNAKATAVTLAEEKNQVVKSNFANADLIYEVAYGDNEENLKGIVSIPEQEDIVPQSFSIEGNTIYILDTLNSQIKVYDLSKKSFMYAVNLSENEYFIDIEVVNGTIYLYSEDGVLSSINNKGEQKTIKEIARTDLYGLYTRKGRLFVSSMNGNSEEIVLNYSDTAAEEKLNSVLFINRETVDRDLLVHKSELAGLGACVIGEDDNGKYVLRNETDWNYGETYIAKISGLKKWFALAVSGREYQHGIPFKKFNIDNGIIYQMVPKETGIAIFKLNWTEKRNTRFTKEMIAAYKELLVTPEEVTTVKALPGYSVNVYRATAIQRALDMINVGWSYNASTMHTPTTGTTQSPTYLGNKNKYCTGIPYCWGGMNGIDTATYSGSSLSNMQNFASAVSSGKTAGNINSTIGSWTSGTFGVDCSGFICASLKIPLKENTTGLVKYFNTRNWNYALAGDVAIQPGNHTFMIAAVNGSSGNGNYMLTTYESTTSGGNECAKIYYRNFIDVVNTYGLYTY